MEENNNELTPEQPNDEFESMGVPEQKRKVYTEQGDPEIDSLYHKWKDGDLNVQPDFQRGFVWDITKASKLIESILLDIPLPVIYLSQEKDSKEYVIDGQQRLTSFFSFIDGKLPDPELPFGKDFRLSKLNVFTELSGKFYKDLPREYQKKIKYYKIRTITFRKESEQDLKFEVFERLNTGSVSLNDQELRNCIYRGKYNDLLWDLSSEKNFRDLIGIKRPERRMRDVELVLRFASFYHATYLNYKSPIKKFLNNDMEKYRNISPSDAVELKNAFKNSISLIKSFLGEHAFKRFYIGSAQSYNGTWEKKKFNYSLFDILMDSFARMDHNLVMRKLDTIREAYINLLTTNQQFIDAIELSTSAAQAVRTRFEIWQTTLSGIMGTTSVEPRCFSLKLKEELFDANPYCKICNQKILKIDDAAVDHVEQYWMGGRTIPQNARLTHRYCNNARARHEQPALPTYPTPQPIGVGGRTTTQRIITIQGETIFCKNNISVLVNTANWLISKGKLNHSNCPIKSFDRGTTFLINTAPKHADRRDFQIKKPLYDNLFLEGNWSGPDCIKKSKKLLLDFEISDFDFDE